MEKARQLPLPSVDFAPEGMRIFIQNEGTTGPIAEFLEETADACVYPERYHRGVVDSAREFYQTYFIDNGLHTRTAGCDKAPR